jgi:hypothetical protein
MDMYRNEFGISYKPNLILLASIDPNLDFQNGKYKKIWCTWITVISLFVSQCSLPP